MSQSSSSASTSGLHRSRRSSLSEETANSGLRHWPAHAPPPGATVVETDSAATTSECTPSTPEWEASDSDSKQISQLDNEAYRTHLTRTQRRRMQRRLAREVLSAAAQAEEAPGGPSPVTQQPAAQPQRLLRRLPSTAAATGSSSAEPALGAGQLAESAADARPSTRLSL
ncbi:unnamed protein product [Prorocentrum cordatum]|uniref:Nuclear transcription factor Y subunit n=1 Tax=Prorocentrum cordatum TaxID=2364126 RepID=A0ABN9VRI5_9DINO|nr:unnamed protein product [Polarella glacialis]